MEEWTDSVKLAVDVLIACIIITALLVCGQLSRTIMNTMDEERAMSADVLAYRIERMYDNTECYSQDIVSLILEYQGTPAVVVHKKSGTVLTWKNTSYQTALSASAISSVLNQASIYRCTLTYDASGTLTAYNFQEV